MMQTLAQWTYIGHRNGGVHDHSHVDAVLDVVVEVRQWLHRDSLSRISFGVEHHDVCEPRNISQMVAGDCMQIHKVQFQFEMFR